MAEKNSHETHKEQVLEGKKVSKSSIHKEERFQKIEAKIKSFDRAGNIHQILGIICLLVGLRRLRAWIVGLLMITLGVLFLVGYFEKKN